MDYDWFHTIERVSRAFWCELLDWNPLFCLLWFTTISYTRPFDVGTFNHFCYSCSLTSHNVVMWSRNADRQHLMSFVSVLGLLCLVMTAVRYTRNIRDYAVHIRWVYKNTGVKSVARWSERAITQSRALAISSWLHPQPHRDWQTGP